MTGLEVLVALVIAVGLVGVIVPVLPGSLLVLGAVLVWAVDIGSTTGWIVFAVATAFIALGNVVKYVVPGRRLKQNEIPNSTLLLGGILGVIGFFVIPVIGMFIGFPVGVYISESQRLRSHAAAWTSTKHALRETGVSMLIELLGTSLAAALWLIAVLFVV